MKQQIPTFLNRLKLSIFIAVATILVAACANEMAPSGGAKDTEPPMMIAANPPNKTVNFKEQKIKIKFNEYLENSAFGRTLISPPTTEAPKYKISLNSVKVTLPQDLEENTTYIINFADDIRDINESNPHSNFVYVFSTGSQIDTQSISGKVKNAFSGEPESEVLIMLYEKDSLENVKSKKPKYFAITNARGEYVIHYVKPGEYALAALKDKNMNFIYDQSQEMIGFRAENINLIDSVSLVQDMQVFTQPNSEIKITEAEERETGKLQIIFSAPIKSLRVDGEITHSKNTSFLNNTRDTLTIWHSSIDQKQAELYFFINDSIKDTARIKLTPILMNENAENKISPLDIDFQQVTNSKGVKISNNLYACGFYESLKIFFSRPITEINDSLPPILVVNDSTQEKIYPKIILDKKTKLFATIEFTKEENSFYSIYILPGKFKDIFATENDSTLLRFQTDDSEKYSVFKLKINSKQNKHRIVEILASIEEAPKKRIFIATAESKTFTYNDFAAGNYIIRVVEDENNNGLWDTGNFDLRKQAEEVRIFKELPELKAGWEAEFELNLDE